MHHEHSQHVPQEPETQPADVREELHQENIDKEGDPRSAADAGAQPDSHFGAVEDEASGHSDQQLVTPPMTGPDHITRGEDDPDEDVDPQDEIVGGA